MRPSSAQLWPRTFEFEFAVQSSNYEFRHVPSYLYVHGRFRRNECMLPHEWFRRNLETMVHEFDDASGWRQPVNRLGTNEFLQREMARGKAVSPIFTVFGISGLIISVCVCVFFVCFFLFSHKLCFSFFTSVSLHIYSKLIGYMLQTKGSLPTSWATCSYYC
jgi:hypothetical protein